MGPRWALDYQAFLQSSRLEADHLAVEWTLQRVKPHLAAIDSQVGETIAAYTKRDYMPCDSCSLPKLFSFLCVLGKAP